jgi:phage-related protein
MLPDRCQLVLDNQVNLLNRLTINDPPLAFPHSSQVEGELGKLRCHYGRDLYRILYRRSLNLFILLHIFRKNTGPIPREEKAIATARWEDFRARMDAQPRTPPRPGSQRRTGPH